MARTPSAVLTETKPSKAVKKAEKVKALKADIKSADKEAGVLAKQLAKIAEKRNKLLSKLSKLEEDKDTVVVVEDTQPLQVETVEVTA